MLHFYLGGDGYYMDDNTTIYRIRNVQNGFADHQFDFQYLPWPLNSLDFNPIEKTWDMVERRLLPSNLQELEICTANAWYSLDVNELQSHVDWVLKRCLKLSV
ncbi:hypothetical protein TNCV_3453981 [Trichonephila clavipes]|nr:hypothetical protein TNCV_3453981 [Trichonephila clavipes]